MLANSGETATNRKYKNSVFTELFGTPEKALELYNAISGKNYPPGTKVKIVTLSDALYMEQLNDIAFVIDGKLVVLVEHQSSINENMPLRMLVYMSREYELLTDRKALYMEHKIKIPSPEFVVLYNGEKEMADFKEMRLSDSFELAQDFPNLDLVVKVYNINKGRNAEMAAKSSSLSGYEEFIAAIRENLKAMSLKEAVKVAIRSCISKNILVEFLTEHGSEVENMLFHKWNMDEALEVRFEEGIEEGVEKGITIGETRGIALGETKGLLHTARNMKAKGFNTAVICEITGLSEAEVEGLD
ncbi:MAG: Rpn family recombination-promoting nuclease/putative transposase [Candidatus Fibromonas sp.]|jgi:predicted transposase/invertase (TIGR01784 family)|nr:Rpn family recombination-promoting nuclease/putative transposase [Candidatus Fibromonas sp.]